MQAFRLFGQPEFMARFHKCAALAWLAIGIFGLVQFLIHLTSHPVADAFSPIAASVPILFFISVYANVVGHWSAWQASRVEVKQDEG